MVCKGTLLGLFLLFFFFVSPAQGQGRGPNFQGSRCAPCRKLDLVFLLENDPYLAPVHFEASKSFVKLFASSYRTNMESGSYQGGAPNFGVVTWNTVDFRDTLGATRVEIPLTSNFTSFSSAVDSILFTSSIQANFTLGLEYAQELLLDEDSDDKTTRVIVLLMAGHDIPNSWLPLNGELRGARLLKQQGTYIIAIAVASPPNSGSWLQFTALSSYFGYNFTNWMVSAWEQLATPAFVSRLTNFTCTLEPLPRLFRPKCPMEPSSYARALKSYPPGNYALGTFLPDNYTTWGYLNIPPPPQFSPLSFTLEFWVFLRSSPLGKNWAFLSQAPRDGLNESSHSLYLGSHDGKIRFVLGNGGNDSAPFLILQSPNTLRERVWYHIAINVEQLAKNESFWPDATDEKYASIWVNGNVWASTIFYSPTIFDSSVIQLGRSNPIQGIQRCDCVFDELKFWDQCQYQRQIAAKANYLLAGSEPNLVAYYNFEDTTSLDFTDLSKNKRVAVQRGASPWIVQVAESSPKCTNSLLSDLRDFETVCKGP